MKNNENINEAAAKKTLGEYADSVGEDDVDNVMDKEYEIKKLFKRVNVLAKYCKDMCEIFELLRARVTDIYKETPWRTVAALTGALIYVLAPIDMIFDFIPIVGYIDDAFVIGLALELAKPDLEKYRAWKTERRR